MILNRIIIVLFVTTFLSSNLLWAGEGQLDILVDTNIEVIGGHTDSHNNMLHHVQDSHHDGHDCHMGAHLLGLNSSEMLIATAQLAEFTDSLDSQLSSRQLPPPNKPPRNA